ncbi:ABC transporter ATP-binding protein [Rufibacter glacialis]|uniref:ABC transporter ATP-binding protein n=1 Tax=Rufibacter glacialis TaxID=1259555 RepID=A0A5M8QED0_9BACT|nr:ABC transporter ATP-binding protein [Rufibacter glacialis]KAA6433451.1 ABC transporter ATP-binding protein [Rufibacter glacialis]GGK74089.1 ABC transporter [Rufibacter glacialis]
MKSLKYLNKYLLKYKFRFFWGIVFVIVSNIFAIIPAQVVRHAFDLVREGITMYQLHEGFSQQERVYDSFARSTLFYGGVIVLMALLRGIFLFFMRQTIIVMSRLIENDLKNEIYAHYQTLPLSFYRRNNTGDLMARISEDVSRVRMYLGPAIMYGVNLLVLFLMVIPYMLSVNVELTLYTLMPLPILSVSIYYVNNIIERKSDEIQKSLSGITTFVQEAFSGIRVLKSFVREQDSHANFTTASDTYRNKSLELNFVNSLFFPLILFLIGLSTIITVWYGGKEVINGSITPGVIAEFLIYVNMLTWPVTALGWTTSLVQRAAASQQRINEFLNTKTDIVSRKNLEKEIKGAIVFDEVDFVYPDTGIHSLKKLSFQINPGDTLAVIGNTGSGKSTIAALICRLYDATGGRILIDGVDIRDYSLTSLRSQIGYVPQDVFLFSDSIRNNIGFGVDSLPEEKMLQAAKDADVYENIMRFPQQFDTVLGERGITLSGGQKQRVSIARALAREPKILILDDSLSAVDTKTENAILNSLQRVMANRTSIIISHRVSSVKLANRILVLDDGVVVQHGSHEELMLETDGLYRALYERQLQTEDID